MHLRANHILAILLTLGLMAGSLHAQSVEIRMQDGSTWRGQVGQQIEVTWTEQSRETTFSGLLVTDKKLYIVVEGQRLGVAVKQMFFKADIVSIRAMQPASPGSGAASTPDRRAGDVTTSSSDPSQTAVSGATTRGVLVLPLSGTVGTLLRHQEIVKITEKADELGPGQIIILHIESNGGSVDEGGFIEDAIKDAKERHRVIAWISKAISGGAFTAIPCDEIYFETGGNLGAITMPRGGAPVEPAMLEKWIDWLEDAMETGGRSRYFGGAMVKNEAMLSYDKDPETGEVTFYPHTGGEFLLSDSNHNLSLNARLALHCGFSDGTADTFEDLAVLLDMEQWVEVSDYGRTLHDRWHATCERAEHDIPKLLQQLNYKNSSAPPAQRLGTRISILQDLMSWMKRCPNIAFQFGMPSKIPRPDLPPVPDYAPIKREIEELRKQIADMRR